MTKNLSTAHEPDRVVLVTAGASGIGRAIAEKFLAHDSRVHICDIDQRAIDEFLDSNPTATATLADVADVDLVDQVFDQLRDLHGGLDILVNNAGISGPTARVEDIETADWDRTIAVDLNGQFYCSRRAIPLLKRAGGGSIINIASSAAFFGVPLRAPYAACKWAILGFTKTLAIELGPFGIRVNAICPGCVNGSRIDGVIEREASSRGTTVDQVRESYRRQSSLRTFIDPDEVAALALFLASDVGAKISGQSLGIDGHTETLSSDLAN